METTSHRIWTWFTDSIPYNDNHYANSLGCYNFNFRIYIYIYTKYQKTQKMALDAVLLNIQYYKVDIKGKVEQIKERRSTLPYISMW